MTTTLVKPQNDIASDKTRKYFWVTKASKVTRKNNVAGDTAPRLRFVVSSTLTDLWGDVMSEFALQRMADMAINRTFFLNHSYNVPEDVFAVVEKAWIEDATLPDIMTGELTACKVLIFEMRLAQENPRAVSTFKLLSQDGVRLGASIGIYVTQSTDLNDGRKQIQDVYYLECSVVGIPLNQQSWATKSANFAFRYHGELIKTNSKLALPKGIRPQPKTQKGDNQMKMKMKMKKTKPKAQAKGKKPAKKSMFAAAVAETSSYYDMCDYFCALQDALGDLIELTEDGKVENPLGELQKILADFSAVVIAAVSPALVPLSGAEGIEKEEDSGDDEDEDDDDDWSDLLTTEGVKMSKSLKAARAFVMGKTMTAKLARLVSKGAGEEGSEKDKYIKTLVQGQLASHMACMKLAEMMHDSDDDDDSEDDDDDNLDDNLDDNDSEDEATKNHDMRMSEDDDDSEDEDDDDDDSEDDDESDDDDSEDDDEDDEDDDDDDSDKKRKQARAKARKSSNLKATKPVRKAASLLNEETMLIINGLKRELKTAQANNQKLLKRVEEAESVAADLGKEVVRMGKQLQPRPTQR